MKVVEMTPKTVEKSKKIKIENASEKKVWWKKKTFEWIGIKRLVYETYKLQYK